MTAILVTKSNKLTFERELDNAIRTLERESSGDIDIQFSTCGTSVGAVYSALVISR